jgi:hypothetical protein
VHGVEHVGDQRVEFAGVEREHRLRDAQQPWVAHLQDFTYRHLSLSPIAMQAKHRRLDPEPRRRHCRACGAGTVAASRFA